MIETWQLKQRQSHPLEIKERLSENRIRSWYEYYNGAVYVSFSGGKDSTVLLHLVRKLYPEVPAVFIDTGLEYPEIREFVKTIENVIYLKPKTPFTEVIEKYGYPVISKEQSQYISEYCNTKSEKLKNIRMFGNKAGQGKISKKWIKMIDAGFKVSHQCCDVMKKNPVKLYEKKTGRKAYLGIMACESSTRIQDYLKSGCNSLEAKRPLSKPLAFWLEKDIWEYIKKYDLLYSKIYDMGYERTGCMFCMFGIHLEKEPNRFQIMKKTHPKLYDYCMDKLGCRKVLDYININYKDEQLVLF